MPAKLERCVEEVRAKGGDVDPWAVCEASVMGRGRNPAKWASPGVEVADATQNPSGDADKYNEIATTYAKGKIDEWERKRASKGRVYAQAWVAEDDGSYGRDIRMVTSPNVTSANSLYIFLHEVAHHELGHPEMGCTVERGGVCWDSYHEYQATKRAFDVMKRHGVEIPKSTEEEAKWAIEQHIKAEKKAGVRVRPEVEEYVAGTETNPWFGFGGQKKSAPKSKISVAPLSESVYNKHVKKLLGGFLKPSFASYQEKYPGTYTAMYEGKLLKVGSKSEVQNWVRSYGAHFRKSNPEDTAAAMCEASVMGKGKHNPNSFYTVDPAQPYKTKFFATLQSARKHAEKLLKTTYSKVVEIRKESESPFGELVERVYPKSNNKRRNPEDTAAAMYESFHGKPSTEVVDVEEEEHYHEHLAELGVLVELGVATVTGYEVWLGFDAESGAETGSNPKRKRNIWPFGPGQPLGSKSYSAKEAAKARYKATTSTRSKAPASAAGKTDAYRGFQITKDSDGYFHIRGIGGKFYSKKIVMEAIDYYRAGVPGTKIAEAFNNPRVKKEVDEWVRNNPHKRRPVDYRVMGQHFSSVKPAIDLAYEQARKDPSKWVTVYANGQVLAEVKDGVEMPSMLKWEMEKEKNPGRRGPIGSAVGSVYELGEYADKQLGRVIGFNPSPSEQGSRNMAQRIENAKRNFVQIIMEKGFTRDEAVKAMNTMLRLKVAKLDAVNGVISVKHGAFLDSSSIRNAVDYKFKKGNPEPVSTATVLLTSNEDGSQLFFIGGDQSLDLDGMKFSEREQEKESIVIGEVFFISYMTRKDFDGMEEIVYEHDAGEETGVYPYLVYDRVNKRLSLSGGEYHIEKPMFETSPGIEN